MTTISFSIEQDLKEDLDRLAAEERKSKSDVFREMYNYYMLKRSLRRMQVEGRVIAARLGIETDDDVYDYLKGRGKFARNDGRAAA